MTSKLISILLTGIICPNYHSQKSKQKPQIDPTAQCTKRHRQSEKILKITAGWDFTYQQRRRQISAGPSAHQTPPNLEISKTYKHTHPPDQTPTRETIMNITNSSKGTPPLVLCGPATQGRCANPPSLCAHAGEGHVSAPAMPTRVRDGRAAAAAMPSRVGEGRAAAVAARPTSAGEAWDLKYGGWGHAVAMGGGG